MEISFQLRTLEPLKGAWDILRLFGQTEGDLIDADTIMDTLDLTERTFSKAMRRLVTKGYTQMDGDMIYRLTDNGRVMVDELLAYDAARGDMPAESKPSRPQIMRRMICAVPATLTAGQPAHVLVGFHPGDLPDDDLVDVVIRATVINGEPTEGEDLIFELDNDEVYQAMVIKPGPYTQIRIRMEAYQLGEISNVAEIGGMYVDVPVMTHAEVQQFIAYGTDLMLIG